MFVSVPGEIDVYYRTRDCVRWSAPDKPLVYLGRIDSQVKILGHRVELDEVEAVVRKCSGLDAVVALAWPINESGADGIAVFLETDTSDTNLHVETVREKITGLHGSTERTSSKPAPVKYERQIRRKALRTMLEVEVRQ